MKKLFILFFILLVSCSSKQIDMRTDASFCNVDADCTCGGIDKNTNNCFVGNRLYASKFVDMSKSCPDFCTGIAGNLETRCVDHKCIVAQRDIVACTADAKLCPDGSAVGRVPPNCEFAPCPENLTSCPEDTKVCGDGSIVVRIPPSCNFQPCSGDDLIACTMDVQECPDGSFVPRIPPTCEFAECPVVNATESNVSEVNVSD